MEPERACEASTRRLRNWINQMERTLTVEFRAWGVDPEGMLRADIAEQIRFGERLKLLEERVSRLEQNRVVD